jgi:C1A family cysteine protease
VSRRKRCPVFLEIVASSIFEEMRSIIFFAWAASTMAGNVPELFKEFMEKYDKHYGTKVEETKRFQIFRENVEMIEATNAKNLTYKLGITSSADQTFEEWRADHLTELAPRLTAAKQHDAFAVPSSFTEPESVDWVAKGGVTSVKNQGTCGSCWTFSTAGALEGAMFVAGRQVVDLSMQHILACDKGGKGCSGGQMDQAFDWVAQNGITSLKDEPYLCQDAKDAQCTAMTCSACQMRTGETCTFLGKCSNGTTCDKTGLIHHCVCPDNQCFQDGVCASQSPPALVLAVGDVVKHTDVDATEMALEAAVAQQPVSVAIEADQAVFQHYTGGILTNDACGSSLDHGVLAVGYGVDNGQKYWKVKNSWGTTFGEEGYIRIEKGKEGTAGECGIRKMASFPTIKSNSETLVV